jgi:hypothetical protein
MHPPASGIIQTFCLPVSLIPVARMAECMNRLAATDCTFLFEFDLMRPAARRCCRETIS